VHRESQGEANKIDMGGVEAGMIRVCQAKQIGFIADVWPVFGDPTEAHQLGNFKIILSSDPGRPARSTIV